MVQARLVKAGYEMVGSRTGRAAAHAQPACQLRLGRRGKCGALFMAHSDPLDAMLYPKRLGKRIDGIADDAEDLADADVG